MADLNDPSYFTSMPQEHGERTFIVTGATRGLGLAITRALARLDDVRVVAAVRDPARAAALELGPRVEIHGLDLGSLTATRAFVAGWRGPIAGLVNNAGLQLGETRRSADGWEETIGVNHLAAFELTVGLLPALVGGRVLFIGSGTINPDNPFPRRLGFRGARFTSIAALARGEGEGSERQLGRDRYATSKFLNMVTAVELARRVAPERARFYTLDPGMMPGTGLARGAPLMARVLWSTLARWLVPLMPHASTPARSAATAVAILTGAPSPSGEVFASDGQPSAHVWPPVRDLVIGRAVVDESLEFLQLVLPAAIAV